MNLLIVVVIMVMGCHQVQADWRGDMPLALDGQGPETGAPSQCGDCVCNQQFPDGIVEMLEQLTSSAQQQKHKPTTWSRQDNDIHTLPQPAADQDRNQNLQLQLDELRRKWAEQNDVIEALNQSLGDQHLVTEDVMDRLRKAEKKVAFAVTLSDEVCHSTESDSDIVPFDTDLYDYGSDFDTATHKFIAPVTGIYVFSVTLQTCRGKEGQVQLRHNGRVVASVYGDEIPGTRVNGAVSVVLHMDREDTVQVVFLDHSALGYKHSILSGFLYANLE